MFIATALKNLSDIVTVSGPFLRLSGEILVEKCLRFPTTSTTQQRWHAEPGTVKVKATKAGACVTQRNDKLNLLSLGR